MDPECWSRGRGSCLAPTPGDLGRSRPVDGFAGCRCLMEESLCLLRAILITDGSQRKAQEVVWALPEAPGWLSRRTR